MPNNNKFPNFKIEWKNGELPGPHYLSQLSKWIWNIDSPDDSVLVSYNPWGINLQAVSNELKIINIKTWDKAKKQGTCDVYGTSKWEAKPIAVDVLCRIQSLPNADVGFDPTHANYWAMAKLVKEPDPDDDMQLIDTYQTVLPPVPDVGDFQCLQYYKNEGTLDNPSWTYYYKICDGGAATRETTLAVTGLDWAEYTKEEEIYFWAECKTTSNNLGDENPGLEVTIKTGNAFPAPYWSGTEVDGEVIVNHPIAFIDADNVIHQEHFGHLILESGCNADTKLELLCKDKGDKELVFITGQYDGEGEFSAHVRKQIRSIQNGQTIRSYIDVPTTPMFINDDLPHYGKVEASQGQLIQKQTTDKYQQGVFIKRTDADDNIIDLSQIGPGSGLTKTYLANIKSYDSSTKLSKGDIYRNGFDAGVTDIDAGVYMHDIPNEDFDPTHDNFWCLVLELAVTTDGDVTAQFETGGFQATQNSQKPPNKEFAINIYHDGSTYYYKVFPGIVEVRNTTQYVAGQDWTAVAAKTCIWLTLEINSTNYGYQDPTLDSATIDTGAAYPTDNLTSNADGNVIAVVRLGKILDSMIVEQDFFGTCQLFGGTNHNTMIDDSFCKDKNGTDIQLFTYEAGQGGIDQCKLRKCITVIMNGNTVRLYWSAAESDKYVNYLTGTNVYGEITADVSTDDHYKINQEIDKNYFQNGVWTHEEGVSPATPIDISTDPGYTFFGDTEIRYNNNNLEYRKKSYTLTIVGGVIQPKAGDWGDWTNILTTSPFTCPQ